MPQNTIKLCQISTFSKRSMKSRFLWRTKVWTMLCFGLAPISVSTGYKKFNREISDEYIAQVGASIMMHGWLVKEKTRITAMKNNVPKTKEKTDAEYAIAVAAQEEWNQMQGLKPIRPTSILEKYQGAEVGRYYLCLYRDVGYAGQDRTEVHPEHHVYGRFRDYLKTGKRRVSHAHLNRSNMVPIDVSIEIFEFRECLQS